MRYKRKSDATRYGVTKQEDALEECFIELGLQCKRHQVFCFLCLSMFTNPNIGKYPSMCDHCGNYYNFRDNKGLKERGMYCMPDLVLEDPTRHGKAVIFVNSQEHHTKKKDVARDKFQIGVLKKNNWRIFVIDNEEVDYLRHSNRCFLALGIWAAMHNANYTMYLKAFTKEKEIPALR